MGNNDWIGCVYFFANENQLNRNSETETENVLK